MITTFTSNDVLRYFYGEVSKKEKAAIEEGLAYNEKLQDTFCDIESVERILKTTTAKPKETTIDNILLYSKTFASSH